MEKIYKILKMVLLALIFVALLLGAKRLYDTLGSQVKVNALATQPTAAAEEPAEVMDATAVAEPEMIVYDIDGNPHKLSDFEGKPVILNFWATWCGYCKLEMPDFEEKYLEYGDKIHFLMVNATDNYGETVEKASNYIMEQGFTFPVYYDTDQTAGQYFNLSSYPVTYLFDAKGEIVAWQKGMLTVETLQTGIDMLLAE
jgi:thiol-disulfide isomerase/thioredoxin